VVGTDVLDEDGGGWGRPDPRGVALDCGAIGVGEVSPGDERMTPLASTSRMEERLTPSDASRQSSAAS
jgi:hypothetical protein